VTKSTQIIDSVLDFKVSSRRIAVTHGTIWYHYISYGRIIVKFIVRIRVMVKLGKLHLWLKL
jgi:hypothetical protein